MTEPTSTGQAVPTASTDAAAEPAVPTASTDTDADPAVPTASTDAAAEPAAAAPSPADETEPWHIDGSGPVPTANGRVRRRWRKVVVRTISKAWGDSLFGMSSQAAFWSALSTAPLLLALLGLTGYVAELFGPGTMDDVRKQTTVFLHTIFNEEVADNLIGNTVDTILNNGQADVVSVGLIISLWAGSSAMTAFVESIATAYGQHEFRHPVLERFFALGLYVGALAAGIVAGAAAGDRAGLPPAPVPGVVASDRHSRSSAGPTIPDWRSA